MIAAQGTYIVVADGGGAVIYRNIGSTAQIRLETVESIDNDVASFTRDIAADKAGRQAGPNGRASAMETTDYHDQEEEAFASHLADRLDEAISFASRELVIFAAPRFLGMLRPHLSADVKAAITAEIPKDFRSSPKADVERALTSIH